MIAKQWLFPSFFLSFSLILPQPFLIWHDVKDVCVWMKEGSVCGETSLNCSDDDGSNNTSVVHQALTMYQAWYQVLYISCSTLMQHLWPWSTRHQDLSYLTSLHSELHSQFYNILLASGLLSYSPCQKCPLALVLHMVSPFLAFQFLLSITPSDSSPPSPTILSHITVHVHHSVYCVKLSVLYTCVLVRYLPVFPFCNLNSATTGTCLSYPHWSL